MNLGEIIGIVGCILTVFGIGLSVYFWRKTYKEVAFTKQLTKQLRELQFEDPDIFNKLQKIADDMYKTGVSTDCVKPKKHKTRHPGKLYKDELVYLLLNFNTNVHRCAESTNEDEMKTIK